MGETPVPPIFFNSPDGGLVRRFAMMTLTTLLWCGTALTGTGCRDDAPPPPRVPVPAAGNRDQARERDYQKPLPPDDWRQTRDYGTTSAPKP